MLAKVSAPTRSSSFKTKLPYEASAPRTESTVVGMVDVGVGPPLSWMLR